MKWHVLLGFVMLMVLSACKKEEYNLVWTELNAPTDVRLNDIVFTDPLNGYACGGTRWIQGDLLRTTDGGASWTIDTLFDNNFNELFIDNDKILIVGYSGSMFQYDPVTTYWNHVRMPELVELHSIAYQDQNNFIVVGGGSFDIGVLYHFNSLNNQPDSSLTDIKHEIQDVCYINAIEAIAVGYGAVYKSYDSGKTWEPKPVQGEFFLTVDFPSPTIGYAAGFTGTIIKTTDGGETWKKLRNGNQIATKRQVFRDMQFVTEDKGYLVGDDGVFWITDDGGKSWKTVDMPEVRLNAVFVDNGTGYIVADEGRIFKFED